MNLRLWLGKMRQDVTDGEGQVDMLEKKFGIEESKTGKKWAGKTRLKKEKLRLVWGRGRERGGGRTMRSEATEVPVEG